MIAQDIYKQRRAALMERFTGSGDVIYLRGNTESVRSADVDWPFRQHSAVRYLTGIDLPDVSMLLVPDEKKYVLFSDERPPVMQMWLGARPSLGEMAAQYLSDEAYPLAELRSVVGRCTGNIHSLRGMSAPFRARRKELSSALYEMRIVKSPEEIAEMEEAIAITAGGIQAAMEATRPGITETGLEGVLDLVWKKHGAVQSWPPIVTTKGSVLHTKAHDSPVRPGTMLLVDVGCEHNGYNSDITRSWPVGGSFTAEQAAVYDIVLAAKKECIAMVKPGVAFADIQRHSQDMIVQGLRDMGVLKAEPVSAEARKLFYPHGLGHWLGLDPHDCAELTKDIGTEDYLSKRTLAPGNVITIEPGIYFSELMIGNAMSMSSAADQIDVEKALRLADAVSGIRIEDDVLVTETGARVLGPGIPEERQDIEAIVGSGYFLAL